MARNHRVAVLVFSPASVFELAVACEVFGIDRSDMGVPSYDVRICSYDEPPLHDQRCRLHHRHAAPPGDAGVGRHDHRAGLAVAEEGAARSRGVRRAAAGASPRRPVRVAVLGRLRPRRRRPARRRPGHHALDVRRRLRRSLPADRRRSRRALRRRRAGVDVGRDRRRHRPVPPLRADGPRRRGRQRGRPAHGGAGPSRRRPGPVRAGAGARDVQRRRPRRHPRLGRRSTSTEELEVEDLARRAKMSPRTFARRFKLATGTTPLQWLLTQRVVLAQRLLEGTDLPDRDGGGAVRVRVGGHAAPALRSGGRHVAGRLPADVPAGRLSRRGASSAPTRSARTMPNAVGTAPHCGARSAG